MNKKYLYIVGSLFSIIIASSIIIPFLLPDTVIVFSNDESSRSDSEKTLQSLRRMDSTQPFYAMKYYGNYGFQDVIKEKFPQSSLFELSGGWGCTCFSAQNTSNAPIFGRNFDWSDEGALFLYTEPNYGFASISTVNLGILGVDPDIDINNPETRSRLLNSPYYLMDGMNEMGLVIGIMAINRASRTYNASQPTISSLDVVRLALEFATTVEEALILWENYNIQFGSVPIHYLLADPYGDSAIVEWIDGDMNIFRSEDPWQVSTNFIFSDGISSCRRYQTATQLLQNHMGGITMETGMEILEECSQDGFTLWSNVYNLDTKEVEMSIGQHYEKSFTFSFN